MQVQSFAPVVSPGSRVLVLGSMPGVASLAAQQYYAHPRNAFWPIMDAVLGVDAGAPYMQRIAQLRDSGVALWDVAGCCVRPGSLDSAIDPASVIPNDFAALFEEAPQIRAIFFNGQSVAQLFRRHAWPAHQTLLGELPQTVLPSTSPANARLDLAAKVQAWRVLAAYLAR